MREHSQLYYFLRLLRLVRNWPVYFLNRFGWIRGERVTYRFRNGLDVTSRSFSIDRTAINEVWFDEIYNPPGFRWEDCRTIVDIGANIGTFTLFAAWKAPQATIWTFEPEPSTAAVLEKNAHQNHLDDRVHVIRKGVAGEDGTRTFYITPTCSWFSSMYKPGNDSKPITIAVLSLRSIFDTYHIDRCDFLKLDCEGAEYEAFYQLPDAYFQRIRFIALEHHPFSTYPNANPTALRTFLEEKGFTVTERPNEIFYARRLSS